MVIPVAKLAIAGSFLLAGDACTIGGAAAQLLTRHSRRDPENVRYYYAVPAETPLEKSGR